MECLRIISYFCLGVLLISFITASLEVSIGDDETEPAVTLGEVVASSVGTFLGLTDTPSSYSGFASNCVKVNAGETGLEFVACGGGGDFSFSDFQNSFSTNHSNVVHSVYNATYAEYAYNQTYDINETQMEISDNQMTILETWLDTLMTALGYIKTSDGGDFYHDNFTESFQNNLSEFTPTFNSTYNATYAEYAYNQTYDINETQMIVSNNQLNILQSWIQTLIGVFTSNENIAFTNQSNNFSPQQNFTNITIEGYAYFDLDRQYWITKNTNGDIFNGISVNALWFHNDENKEEGNIAFLGTQQNNTMFWWQVGRNNSYSGTGNSFGVIPNSMGINNFSNADGTINMTQLSDYVNICSIFGFPCQFAADTDGNAQGSIPGGPLLFTMGDLEVWQETRLHNSTRIDNDLDVFLEGGNDMDVIGDIHIRKSREEIVGVVAGQEVVRFYEDFETGDLGGFTLLTTGKGSDEWSAVTGILCPDNGDFCAQAGPAGSIESTIIESNFSTSNTSQMNLTFNINTLFMPSGGILNVTITNQSNTPELEVYSLVTTDVSSSQVIVDITEGHWNSSKVSLRFYFLSTHPNRGDVWVDNIQVNGTATEDSTNNVTRTDTLIRGGTGDGTVFILYNDTSKQWVFSPGNVSFTDVTESSLNVTSNITLNGTTINGWNEIPFFYLKTIVNLLVQGNKSELQSDIYDNYSNSFLNNISSFTPTFNATQNQTYEDFVYGNYTNRSNYWDDTDTYNATQMEVSGEQLTILETWLDTLMTALGYIKSSIGDGQKNATGTYLYNDTDTIYFNDTLLNETIDRIVDASNNSIGGGGDFYFDNFSASFQNNLSEFTPVFNATQNQTYEDYVYANYTNESNYWDEVDTYNSTILTHNENVLTIVISWFTDRFFVKETTSTMITGNITALNQSGFDSFINKTGTQIDFEDKNLTNVDIICLNPTCTAYFNDTCRVMSNGATDCEGT